MENKRFLEKSLFEREFEKDNCGMGFIANIDGLKTNKTIKDGIRILMGLEHRGASGYDSETGDGAGLLFEIPDAFFRDICENLPKAGFSIWGYFKKITGIAKEAVTEIKSIKDGDSPQ